ncbi:DNA-directed RNA polymerase subunit beta'', putative (apicoplast) [Hepatocystis sp. ex Piliocolobus tephrosceles]|nr:DNA-directed RNA polymerase subunit beta'', putative [Hepatocystis sp. ex Piliocolobus tephrosceles]
MYFYFFNKYNLKILEKKLLSIFKYNISSKILHELLYLGFEYSFLYNYSLNLNDFSNFIYLLILYKNKINNIYNNKYYEIKYNYINIFLTNYHYLKIIDNIQNILNYNMYYKINPIYSNLFFFFNNKIKIKYSQLQSLVGYKGYISNIKGIIYEKPIINNYINELNIYEYILSCYGSKKGIIDTALKTADSGYLTKRLVNITNNFIIKEINCKSPFLFKYTCNMDIYGNIILPLNMLQFKLLQNNIININKGIFINIKNTYIIKYILNKLLNLEYKNYIYLYVKSLYLCNIFNNICNNCLNYKQLYKYNLGQHIGVIASEAISEPSTQMVLRTFHANSILQNKFNYNILNKDIIYKLYPYKFKINKIFKIIFNFKKHINSKFNLIFLINKLLIKYKFNNIYYNYIIPNKFIKYNFIYNSISKNFKYDFNNIIIKYLDGYIKYYTNNVIQLLIKNIYNKWIIYNLYTYYIYYNYIKLYNINNKGIIYNNNTNFYNYNYNNISNLYLSDITIGLKSINIIFENKNIKNNISFISNNIFVIFYIKYYNYLNNIIYIYNVFNKNKITNFNYKLNFYSYIFEDISSILYSGYTLNTDFYSINNNLKLYFNYLLTNINIYQSTKSSFIYIYNILMESILKQYNYQNIYLPSIYFELIIKKMLSCIKILSYNFKLFKYNDIIPLNLINIINYSLNLNKYNIYKYEPIILGITKSILANSGFLSNISFQNTFKIISLNILNNKIDWLVDIKSKIIMTDLLPIGNGWYRYLAN